MINIYDLTQVEVSQILNSIPTIVSNGICYPVFIFHYNEAQNLIDNYIKNRDQIPHLLPVQFRYMLSKSGLEQSMLILLNALQTLDIERYAIYNAYLNSARYYEFNKTLNMYNDIKSKLIEINPNLNFTTEELKLMWINASKV